MLVNYWKKKYETLKETNKLLVEEIKLKDKEIINQIESRAADVSEFTKNYDEMIKKLKQIEKELKRKDTQVRQSNSHNKRLLNISRIAIDGMETDIRIRRGFEVAIEGLERKNRTIKELRDTLDNSRLTDANET